MNQRTISLAEDIRTPSARDLGMEHEVFI